MPQLYNNAVITDAGLSLLNKVQAGTVSIQFTRMATGSGIYTADERAPSALKKCITLKAGKNSYPLSSVGTVPDGGIKLTALITNQDPASGAILVSEGYYINEIGLFAREKDGDSSTEVLYSITVARGDTGDYMPPYETGAPVQIVQEYHAKVGNATSVTINSAGAVMLVEDAQREFEDLKRMIDGGGAIGEKTLTFEAAETRENIASGDRMDTILGKIRKVFADLSPVSFSGKYPDLDDVPKVMKNPEPLRFTGASTATYDGSTEEIVDIPSYNVFVKSGSGAGSGLVPSPGTTAGTTRYLREDGTWSTPPNNDTTYGVATQSADGLLSSSDKKKLDGLPDAVSSIPAGLTSGYVRTGQKSGKAAGDHATAEGRNTDATGNSSHAEGYVTTASGYSSHAEGYATTASNETSHAEGSHAKATGDSSHAEGFDTTASGDFSHAEGTGTTASNHASHVSGKFNKDMTNGGSDNNKIGDAFVVGNGSGSAARSNALRVTYSGAVYGTGNYNTSGADYAEFIYEWSDKNKDDEDRVGYFVTVKDRLLYKAGPGEHIVGITSGNPSIVGNADEDYYWRWERDEFDRIIWIDVPEMVEKVDGDGNVVRDRETGMPVMVETGRVIKNGDMKPNPDYDPSKQDLYIERKDRPEWDYVGMLGVLPVRDDGTCIEGGYCKCGEGGIATSAPERGFDTYIVIERVNDHVVKVILK